LKLKVNHRERALYVAFVALSSLAMKIGWIIPDGAGYASYIASLFLDGDLNFWNQYVMSGIITPDLIHGSTLTTNGYVFTFWGIGAPLLWMPFWLLGHALTLLSHFIGQSWTPNGFTFYYNFAVRFGTALMGFCALILNTAWARKYCGSRPAIIGILLTAIGTPYYWYLFNFADCSHVPASFAIMLFLVLWERYRTEREKTTGLLLGLLGGFVTMVKPNHVFIFLFPIAMWLAEWRKQSRADLLKQATTVFAGYVIAFGVQMWIWQILFGNPLGPILEKGVTHYYKFFAGRFWLIDVLFSSYHGLFFFAPIAICSFLGLAKLIRMDRIVAIPALLILIIQILLMASERYFWEGVSFGLRRVVDWTPLFALGIAYSIKTIFRGKWIMLPVVATLWTALLAFIYSRHPIGLLNDYQPPAVILNWMADSLRDLPAAIRSLFSLPAPAKLFLPAMIIFSIGGYFIYKAILHFGSACLEEGNERRKTLQVFSVIVIALVLTGYALIGRAAIRGDQSKLHYARELKWLAKNQDRIMAGEELSFLLNEGKYLVLTRNWDAARPSFEEAIQTSPVPQETIREISDFTQQHLPPPEARKYLDSLHTKQH
jgi:hypothetical protein